MCETASIKSVLDELAVRHKVPNLKLALSKINEFYSYRRGMGGDSDLGISNLNDFLGRRGYIVQVSTGKDSDLELLKAMIESDECSFPIISVSPTYFEEQNRRYRAAGEFTWEHVLIVLGVNDGSSSSTRTKSSC